MMKVPLAWAASKFHLIQFESDSLTKMWTCLFFHIDGLIQISSVWILIGLVEKEKVIIV